MTDAKGHGGYGPIILGMPRSGTTLLARILRAHPRMSILMQPLPLLYPTLKRRFLLERTASPEAETAYPCNDAMGPNAFSSNDLGDFLDGLRCDPGLGHSLLEAMDEYSGWVDRGPAETVLAHLEPEVTPMDLIERVLAEAGDPADYRGCKEVTAEEFLPWFLRHCIRSVLIIRDPRDIIASQTTGLGRDHTGRARPLLFNIRMWRKLVALHAKASAQPHYHMLRYEDLVRRPREQAAELCHWLGAEDASERMVREAGDEIATASIARYRRDLPADRIRLIEACCFDELRSLGYETGIREAEVPEILRFGISQNPAEDPAEEMERPELAYWRWSRERQAEELRRWEARQDVV